MVYHNKFNDSTDDLVGSPTLDRPLRFTTFPSQSGTRKRDKRLTLRQMADLIEKTEASDKTNLPWFKGAVFGSDKSVSPSGHSYRSNANVLAVTGVEADYDGEEIMPEDARDMLAEAGIAGLVYTTPSHSPDAPRWRVFSPFAEELPPEDRALHMARLNGVLGGKLDPASFTLSQSYYFGNVRGRLKVKTWLVEGRFIDRADDLDAGAIGKSGRKKAEGANDNSTDEKELLEAIATGTNYHGSTTALAGKWASAGVPFAEAIRALMAAFLRSPLHDERWQARMTALSSTVADIYARQQKEDEAEKNRQEEVFDSEAEIDADIEELVGTPREASGHDHGLTFLKPSECDIAEARKPVIKGLVAEGDVACIVGAPGVGKSLLAPRLAYAVAQGHDIFGMRVKQGNVMYVAAEDHHGMKARVRALYQDHGDTDNFALVGGVSDLLSKSSEHLKRLKGAVKERRPSLIVIDTLAMAFPGLEENSAEGMGRVVAVARSLTKWGAAVILIHHDTKDGQQGLPRGHSLLNGALDVAIHLTKADGVVRAKLTKNRNGSTDRDIAFTIGTRTLGMDEDDEAITAAVCQVLAHHEMPDRSVRLTPSADAAYSIFLELLDGGEHVEDETWRKACVDGRTVSAAEDADSRRRGYKRAVEELTRKAKVVFADGRFTRPETYREGFDYAEG